MKVVTAWKTTGWKVKALVVMLALYLLYLLAGFFWLPGLVRDNAREALSELTGRDVVINEVTFNPLLLSAEMKAFAIADQQTGVLVGFDRLYVNFQLSSLFRRAWYFDEISLDGLRLRAQRNQGTVFNFDDVIAHLEARLDAQPDDEGADVEDKEEGGLPNLAIGSLTLTSGELSYKEAVGKAPHELVLPVAFTVNNFSTVAKGDNQNDYAIRLEGPDGGVLDWSGHFGFAPFAAIGRLQVEGVDLVSLAKLGAAQVRFTVPSGQLDVEAEYAFTAQPEAQLTVSSGQLVLRDLAIQNPAETTPSVELPEVKVTGVGLDTLAQTVTLPELTIKQPRIRAVLDAAGLDLATLFLPPDPEDAEARKQAVRETAEEAAERITAADTRWRVQLDRLQVDNSRLELLDRTLTPARSLTLEEGRLVLNDLVLGEPAPFSWEGSATLQKSGKLVHSGKGQLAPLSISTSASLSALPLEPFSPWLERAMPLSLTAGVLGAQVQTEIEGEAPDISVSADATVSGLRLLENGDSLLKLNQSRIKGLSVSTARRQVAVSEIALTGMDLAHRIDKQGRDVASRIEAATEAPAARAAGDQSSPWQVDVKRVRVVGSQLRHEDLSLRPNFKIGLYQLSGMVTNLTTRPGSRARLDLDAQVDRYAPFSLKGSVSPAPLYTDIKVSLDNYDMTGLTPFTGLYLGYKVEKGQLGLNSQVAIANQQLESVSDIRADQFYLGNKIPSEQAVTAPVKLGLSVLRSRAGKISLPVTMSGNLNDPSFSVSGMILKVLTNIVVKAATAPFSVLAGLAGGENLQQIEFAPGSADVEGQTRTSLQSLSAVLAEKPQLRIGLVGTTNGDDRVALAGRAIGEAIEGDDWAGIDAAVADKRARRKLIRRYESRYGQDVESLLTIPLPQDKDAADAALARAAWETMLEQEARTVTRRQIAELARQRSENAKTILIQALGVAQSRVYLHESAVDGKVSGLTLTVEK